MLSEKVIMALPLSSKTHSFWLWSYQPFSGEHCPLEMILSIFSALFSISVSKNSFSQLLEIGE